MKKNLDIMKPLHSEHILPSLYQGFTVLYDQLAVS